MTVATAVMTVMAQRKMAVMLVVVEWKRGVMAARMEVVRKEMVLV
jgi:hypothetical protein